MNRRIDLPPFPESWYRVANSSEVGRGDLVSLRCFGQDWICWRGESGDAHVQSAYCAHLGANIGHGGRVEGDTVVCPFHHWRYNGEGRNVEIPYRDKPQRAAILGCLPVAEVNGHIYAWYSPEGRAPDWRPPEIAEATDPRYMRVDSDYWEIRTHVQEIFENTVDVAHFQFVHGVSGFGAVELYEDGPSFRAVASVTMQTKRGEVEGAIESELWGMGIDLVRQRGLGPGRTIFTITPIEEDLVRARYTFFVERDEETGEPTNYGRGLIKEFSRQITQDIPIWEHKIYRRQPRLAMGEGAIVDYRRWAEQFYPQPAAAAA